MSFDQGGLYIIGHKNDLVKVFDGIVTSPCSHWGVQFTQYRGNWQSDPNYRYESNLFCFKNENMTLVERADGSKMLEITKDAISINQPQFIDQSLLPEQDCSQYLFPFIGGAAYGVVSLALDSCFEYGVAKKYPRSKMAYQLGRNILFGGPLLGTIQTAYNKFLDRLFPRNHNKSLSMSTAEFFLRNGLLFIPLTQGVTIPAMLSMAGATSSQYLIKKVILRLGQVNTES